MFRKIDSRECRQNNLNFLVQKFGQSVVAKHTGKPARQIGDIVAGRKACGEKLARAMEANWKDSTGQVLDLDTLGQPLEAEDASSPFPDMLDSEVERFEEIVIPQFDMSAAGTHLELQDQPGVIHSWSVSPEWLQSNVKSTATAAKLRIVTGFGDSMRPMFNPGDPLIVDTAIRSVEFDAVYFFRVENKGFIKRLQQVPGKGILAISANSAYRDWVIEPGMDFEVFGRVLKAWCGEDF